MRDASQYPVTDPFGATYSPWSTKHPHLGDDRAMRVGVQVIVSGVLIGLSGKTGKANGAHLHIQKLQKGAAVNPNGAGFSVEGTVTRVGENEVRGKYVDITDLKGVVWSYFHLSEINVKVGDKIGGDVKATVNDLKYLYLGIYAQDIPEKELAKDPYLGQDLGLVAMQLCDYANKNKFAYWQYKPQAEKRIKELEADGEYVETKVYVKKGTK